jgi:hypothetical protein
MSRYYNNKNMLKSALKSGKQTKICKICLVKMKYLATWFIQGAKLVGPYSCTLLIAF